MGDISNRVLAVLLVVAIVVSFAGTLISLNRLYKNIYPITAFVTVPNATATLTLQTGASLRFLSPTSINWGTGYVNVSGSNPKNCTLDTLNGRSKGCSAGFSRASNGFTIENDGNANLTINLTINRTLLQFIGINKGNFTFNVSLNESGSCQNSSSAAVYPMPYINVTYDAARGGTEPSWKQVDANIIDGIRACYRLRYEDANDALNIDLNVSIPDNAPTGAKTVGVIAKGTSI